MLRALTFLMVLFPVAALAQTAPDAPATTMNHQMMDHATMHGQAAGQLPTQPGQSAFAAIQEIVGLLEADPGTDWSAVNIDALRQHLVDMDAVTLHATVASEPVAAGIRFVVTGDGPVSSSIRRMVAAHAATMNGVNGWQFTATEISGGAALTVTAPQSDREKLRALGFFGILTIGMHHQEHHWMIARGADPHH